MANDPAFLFYSSDFRTETITFTDEQVGQYIRLICDQHQVGHLPQHHILNITKSLDSVVAKKFILDDNGLYYNAKIDAEIERRKNFCQSRRESRAKGIENKQNNSHTLQHTLQHTSSHTSIDTLQRMETETITVTNTENKEITSRIKKKFIPPTKEDVVLYFKENGYSELAAEKAFNYYNIADWIDSRGYKIKNWKQKMQGVWFKDENKDKLLIKKQPVFVP